MIGWITAIILIILFLILYRHLKKLTSRCVDSRGYLRNGYGDLIHRDVAYKQLYDYPNKHNRRFRCYDIHHIDRNKLNNHPSNLKILTREEHKAEHGV